MKETIKARALPAHIDAIKPPAKGERLVSDSVVPNLYLRVGHGGGRSWRWQSVVDGKTIKRGIGKWPLVSLADARDEARTFNTHRTERNLERAPTFADALDKWIEDKKATKKAVRSLHEYERMLKVNCLPFIGSKRVDEITRGDIDKIIAAMRERDAMVSSNRVATVLKQVFKWMERREWVAKNVANHVTAYNETRHIEESIAFTVRQMAELYVAAGDLDEDNRDAYRLLILTGTRRNETFAARMADYVEGVWTLPPPERTENGVTYPLSHTKNGAPHPMQLAPVGRAILDRRKSREYAFSLVEPGPFNHRKALGYLREAVTRYGFDFPQSWENREIRRGFRTALVSDEMFDRGHDFSESDCEIALNHKLPKLTRTYSKARHQARIGRMLAAWEELLLEEVAKVEARLLPKAA